jgi:CHAT domain-containing protein/tetratricopeptide (TPR) repeat protein
MNDNATADQQWQRLTPAQQQALLTVALLTNPATALLDQLNITTDLVRLQAADMLTRAWQIAPPWQTIAQAAFEHDPDLRATLHLKIARAAAELLERDTQADVEALFAEHLEAGCEALIRQEPTALRELTQTMPTNGLRQARSRQMLDYYQAVGAGLRDDFAVACTALDVLVADATLADDLRGKALNAGALFAQSAGDYQRASDWYAASYALWERLDNHMRMGLARNNLGILYYELQEYATAEACFRDALARFEAVGALFQQGLANNELGLLARDHGRWDEALAHFQRAADLFAAEHADDFLGRTINNIGEVELLRGNLHGVADYFFRALKLMTTRLYEVDSWLHLGLLAQAEGEEPLALEHYTTALQLAESIGRHDIIPLLHYRIGQTCERLDRSDEALVQYQLAVAAIEARRTPLRDEGLLISLLGRWQLVYEALVLLCLARGDAAEAMAYAERARARAFTELLLRARQMPLPTSDAPAPLLPADRVLLAFFTTGLQGPEQALLKAIPAHASALRAVLTPAAQLVRFVQTASGITAERCSLNPNALVASTYQSDGQRFLRPAVLQRLAETLIQPVLATLQSAAEVLIVPHGPLHQVPFAALFHQLGSPVPRMRSLPAAYLASNPRPYTPAPRRLLTIGYAGPANELPEASAEAHALAATHGGDALIASEQALAQFQAHAAEYATIHIACHGEFDPDDPLASWLALGPEQRLTASAVLSNVALNAQLVTMNACRSGVSRLLRGDEPFGLVRAFLGAGAQQVLVTLWQVEDRAARLLIERFYAELAATNAVEALRRAQYWLQGYHEAGQTPYAAPFFWAGYTLIGTETRS